MRKSIIKSIAMLALMLVSVGAWAQGGASPYIGSTHVYTVNMEDGNNTPNWEITDPSGTPLTSQPTAYMTESKTGNTATLELTYDASWASVASPTGTANYQIRFTESTSTSCVALRKLDVEVLDNSFYVTTATNYSDCNPESGEVHAQGDVATHDFTIKVDLHNSGAAFDTWNFDYKLTLNAESGQTTAASIQSVTINGQVLASPGTGTLTSPNIAGTTGSINVVVSVEGEVDADQTVQLDIVGGSAQKGASTTPDNGDTTVSRTGTYTITGLPDTGDIQTDL